MKRLAIITSHPIQYNAPFFRLLAERKKIEIKVFYTWGQIEHEEKYDPGFGKKIEWDIPLLGGYNYVFVKNVSTAPGSHHFKGIDNPSLIADVEAWNADAVLVFGWSFKSHLKLLRYFKNKKKVLFRGDSNLLDERKGLSFKKIIRRIFLQWVYSNIDTALYTGSANKNYFLQHGLTEKQLVFAPHAIDNKRFMESERDAKRKSLGIPNSAVVFIFIGKLEPKKDPQLLLEAFVELPNDQAHLILVGNGMLEDSLKQMVSELSTAVKQRIHFIPFQNQLAMPTVYRMGDVMVLPSKGPGETWGLAVNEAMACSMPVIVSNKCGCAEDLVKNGVNGYIFESSDKQSLQHKMALLLEDKNSLYKMGKNSQLAIQPWNYSATCTAVEKVVSTD